MAPNVSTVGNAAFSSYSGLGLFDGLERDMTMNTDVSNVSTRAWQHLWYVSIVSNVSMASAVSYSFFDLLFPNSFFDQAVP